MPTFTGRYTLEFECTVDAPDGYAASEELKRHLGAKDQAGKILSIVRNDLPADHVSEAQEVKPKAYRRKPRASAPARKGHRR